MNPKLRRPYILACKHTICELCAIPKKITTVTCQICNHQQNTNDLEVNFFLYGLMWFKSHDMKKETDVKKQAANPEEGNVPVKKNACHECQKVEANVLCEQCLVKYCFNCYDTIHKTAKVLRNHRYKKLKVDVKQKVFTAVTRKCMEHKNTCDKYCERCSECICSLCENDIHISHRTKSLLLENTRHLHTVSDTLQSIRTRIKICRQSLQVSFFSYIIWLPCLRN